MNSKPYDLLVIGGGINGVSIARDAAGRGLSVLLCEMGDLGGATSSASSKLIHGGLRYLEHYAFRLVANALREREVLLASAPHIVWPMRFVLPHVPELRPVWMIRAGLWLYDRLGGRRRLARSRKIRLPGSEFAAGLRPGLETGFVYSDCWVDDARLVVLAAVDAARLGAEVLPRTRCGKARRAGDVWQADLATENGPRTVTARVLVNAAGPWVEQVVAEVAGDNTPARLRLIKGSHIIIGRRITGDHALILQNDDGRVIFVLPYEQDSTLIGTTDVPFEGDPAKVVISSDEIDYLCRAASRYLAEPVTPEQVVWQYAGVRPLYDDGEGDPSDVTRDYVLTLDGEDGRPPLLSIFGGKITTARVLAETVLERLVPFLPGLAPEWTATATLPGGDIGDFDQFLDDLGGRFAGFERHWLAGLARRHGSRAGDILDGATGPSNLGEDFGGGLYAREVDWLIEHEWAREPSDVLWRRTKLGLRLSEAEQEALSRYMARILSGKSLNTDSTPQSVS